MNETKQKNSATFPLMQVKRKLLNCLLFCSLKQSGDGNFHFIKRIHGLSSDTPEGERGGGALV